MSPTSQTGQDAAVAVLQAQQSSLEASLRDLAKTMSEGFASITAKVDRVNELATRIAEMSAREEAHSDGLRRAFVEIEDQGQSLMRITDSHASYTEKHAREHTALDKAMATARGVVIGITLAAGAICSLVVWAAASYIADTKNNTERIHQIELEQARRLPGKLP